MESNSNRRDFLKKAAVVSALSQIPLISWAGRLSSLLGEGINPAGEFSLLKLDKLLADYHYPALSNFSTSSFDSNFALYNLYGRNAFEAGDFRLKAEPQGENLKFRFSSSRLANNGIQDKSRVFKYLVSGEVSCLPDEVYSPQVWSVSSRIALSADGEAFRGTGLKNNGTAKDGEIRLDYGGKLIRKSFGSGMLAWKWGLMAVVQKMSEQSIQELHFPLLDEFDAIYPVQRLKFRRRVTLDCGTAGNIDFKLYDLLGDGIIPTVYWVDRMHRTLFVISGMEAYLFKA